MTKNKNEDGLAEIKRAGKRLEAASDRVHKKSKSKKPKKIDPFLVHEALDRVHVQSEVFHDLVMEHPVIKKDKALKARAENLFEQFYELYNDVGLFALNNDELS